MRAGRVAYDVTHGPAGACAEDYAFQQRITGQPVGAVYAGTRGFAGREQAGQAAAAIEIGTHTPHGVMRRRMHGRGLSRQVHAVLEARFIDSRKARADEIRAAVPQVEKNVGCAGGSHFRNNGACHHVARGELFQPVIALHESFFARIDQISALPAQGLRQQKARGALDAQRRGMELHELDVADFSAGAPGHGHAVTRRHVRICGLEIQAAWRPAARRHNIWELVVHAAYWKYSAWRRLTGQPRGSFPFKGSNWFERPRESTERAWQDLQSADEAAKKKTSAKIDAELPHFGTVGAAACDSQGNLAAGGIAMGVQDAAAAVRALLRERELRALAIELRAPLDELLDGRGTVFD